MIKTTLLLYLTIAVLSLSLLSGCSSALGKTEHGSPYNFRFEKSGELNIPLDFETTFEALGPQIVDQELIFANPPTNSLKVYDLKTLKLKESIPIQSEGPNAINAPLGLATMNGNIGVYEFYSQTLKFINTRGEVIDTLSTAVEQLEKSGTLPTALSPLLTGKEYMYISAQGSHQPNKHINHDDHTIKRINLKDRNIETFLNYPKNYSNPVTGGKQSIIATTYNPNTQSLIASFPLDHNIYELTNRGEVITHEIEPTVFESFENNYFKSFEQITRSKWVEVKEKFWKSHTYWALHYDPYREIYIRFINLPISSSVDVSDDSIQEASVRKYQAIILDSNFEVITVTPPISGINLSLNKAKFFSTESGFHVFSNDQSNEDVMRFITFNLFEN